MKQRRFEDPNWPRGHKGISCAHEPFNYIDVVDDGQCAELDFSPGDDV